MRTKRYTILLSSFLVMGNIIFFIVLQFRLYHIFSIYGNGSEFFKNLREFFIVVTGGLFTSSCVTLIISIQEYHVEKEAALRSLLRLINNVREKYHQIHFFTPNIPEDIIVTYLLSKHRYEAENYEKEIKFCNDNNLEKDKALMDAYHKVMEKEKKFRECIWEKESEWIKNLYTSKEEKEKYLDKKCSEIEEEYKQKIARFIESLQVFNDFDVYQVQEAFDKLSFFHHKGNKIILEGRLLPYLVTDIKLIKFYLNLTSTKEELYENSLFAFKTLNRTLLEFSRDRKKAYLSVVFNIDLGKRLAEIVIDPKKANEKLPDISHYIIYSYPDMGMGEDIIFDALEV